MGTKWKSLLLSVMSGLLLASQASVAQAAGFTDLSGYGWATKDINYLVGAGIIKGTSATTFDPSGAVTNAEFAAMFYRAFKGPIDNTNYFVPIAGYHQYPDVAKGAWYYSAATNVGGFMPCAGQDANGNCLFEPNQPITRATVAITIGDAADSVIHGIISSSQDIYGEGKSQAIVAPYPDLHGYSGSQRSYLAQTIYLGIMKGITPNQFNPNGNLTRAQLAVLMYRLYTKF